MGRICCFTGHRQISPQDGTYLPDAMDRALEEMIGAGVTTFRAGGAMGFDNFAALKVLNLKRKYGFVRLHLFLPCENQAKGWSEREREFYDYILAHADEITYASREYFKGCMHLRNRMMVDGSDFCIAYCNKNEGGTAYTVRYAAEKGVKLINVATGDNCLRAIRQV